VHLITKFRQWLDRILEKPVLTNTLVLMTAMVVVFVASIPYYKKGGFLGGILQEAHGMLFDIAIIGILIYWLNDRGRTQQLIRSYKDEIDDFRMWESEEAAFRTVGNIKRLNRNGISDINLVNCHLAKTNLSEVNLNGSNMNSANMASSVLAGANLSKTRLNQTNFENANLNNADMKGSFASGAVFKDAYLIKADFEGSFLIKADFENAYMMESNLRDCHLTGAEFKDANLYKVDFRGAIGLTVEQLSEAKSLYLSLFDEELSKKVMDLVPELVG
jgi:uncharacterized protein YjbI with pentapeptide repeats